MKNAIFIALLLCGVVGYAGQAGAQFLCSGGPSDGASCQSDDDCAPNQGGACVIIQGVCQGGGTDGFPCDCPSGVCDASPVCADDASLGTCRGGVFNAECCDAVNYNCEDNAPCVGSQKICCSGTDKGFSCLSNSQCTGGGTCVSTGKFCDGGDFDSYTCCDDSDCGTGISCVTAAGDPPTNTPTKVLTATPRRTSTPTIPTSPQPSNTFTPTRHTPTGTPPSPTRTPTIGVGNTVTPTVTVATSSALAQDIGPNDTVITVSNGSLLPGSGTIQIDAERIRYLGRNGNTLVNVSRGVDGTFRASHAVGTTITVVPTVPTPTVAGPSVVHGQVSQGGACAIAASSTASPSVWGLVGLVGLIIRLRRRG